jgi:hypothetical protein
MVKFAKVGLALFASVLILTACDDEKDIKPLVIPAEYSGESFSTNAADELALLTSLKSVRDEAFKGRSNGQLVSSETLLTNFTAGAPSLEDVASTYYAAKLTSANGHFDEIELASGNTYTLGSTDGNGGTFGGYLFEEHGVELEQLIEKGMFGSVLYNHAVALMSGSLDNTTTDRVLAIFGANPTFPSSSDATKHESPDKYAAVYAARRDKHDGNGFYSNIKSNLIKLQAAIEAGNDYKKDQQDAILAIEKNWEESNAATVIFYLNEVISKLSETDPADNTKGAALHSLGECIGFMDGLKTIPQDHKKITDNEIEEILALFLYPAEGEAAAYAFATEPATNLPKLQEVIAKLKTIYGFSETQMEEFKINWVAVQGR